MFWGWITHRMNRNQAVRNQARAELARAMDELTGPTSFGKININPDPYPDTTYVDGKFYPMTTKIQPGETIAE